MNFTAQVKLLTTAYVPVVFQKRFYDLGERLEGKGCQ